MQVKYFKMLAGQCSHWIVRSYHFVSILLILTGISFAETWIPFANAEKGIVSQTNNLLSYTDTRFEQSAVATQWYITINFPGAVRSNPDDNGLLAGKFDELKFLGNSNKLMGYRINGTIRPEKLGTPNLPFVRFLVQIPSSIKDMSQFSVKAVNANFKEITGEFNIAPVQKQLFESFIPGVHPDDRVFQRRDDIYTKDAYYTHELECELNSIHGLKVLDIKYCPVKYNPVINKLLVSDNVQFAVTYNSTEGNTSTSYKFSQVVRRAAFNGVANRRSIDHLNKGRGGKFVVVGHPDLTGTPEFNDYLDWRKAQGFELVETIDASTTSTSQITTELKSLYQESQFEYLLIVGDDTKIDSPTGGSSSEDYHYKNWSWLDGGDEIADVFMGIILADGVERLKNIIEHQKLQERGGEWSKTVIMAFGLETKNGVAGRFSSSHYSVKDLDDPNGDFGYTVNRVYKGAQVQQYGGSNSFCNIPQADFEPWTLDPNPFFSNSTEATNKVAEYWNQGAALVGHRDHGGKTGPSSPKMTGSWMNSSIKHECSPLMTSLNCLSGNFKSGHSSNFTYQSQGNEFGSCATISAPVVTMSGDNDYNHLALYKAMFPMDGSDPIRNVGQIFIAGQIAAKSHGRTYFHIHGDPLTDLSMGDNQKYAEISFPNGGDKLEVGRTFTVAWKDNVDDNVKIELFKSGTLKEELAASTESDGEFEWKIADNFEMGTDYVIKITCVTLDTVVDESDSNFTIEKQHNLELTSPNGGDYIEKDSECEITWTDDLDGAVKLDILRDGSFYKNIVESVASNGSYKWNVSDDINSGDNYRICISSIEKDWFFDESDDNISIQNPAVTEFPYVQDYEGFTSGGSVFREYWEQLDDEDFNWLVHTGATPSKVGSEPDKTGPDGDHTTGGGNYIYVEASGDNNPSKKTNMISPIFNFSSLKEGVCTFWYHMFSAENEMGDLYLDLSIDGVLKQDVVHLTDDQGDEWHQETIDLAEYAGKKVQFIFRGITGASWCSDIGIDDFEIKGTLNHLPAFTTSGDTSALVGQEYVYNIAAEDTDSGDKLTLEAASLPSWLSFTDNDDGTAELKGTPEEKHIGDTIVVLTCTDGFLADPVRQEFILTVEKPVNVIHIPVDFSRNTRLRAVPNPAKRDNNKIEFYIDASDIQKGKLIVYDALGNTVFNKVIDPGGQEKITWNLRVAQTGNTVYNGAYLALFIFADADGSPKAMKLEIGIK